MDKREAKGLIRTYLNQSCVALRRHAKERMAERGVTIDDLTKALMWGEVVKVEFAPGHGTMKCQVKGADVEGDELTVIVALDTARRQVIVITAC